MNDLIKIAVALAIALVSSQNLPIILKNGRKAQLQLLRDSRTSGWGKPWTPQR